MVCTTIFAIHKRIQHAYFNVRSSSFFQRLLLMVKVSQILRSTYRKSTERRSSVQKSKLDHNIIIRG